jgi:hypothetical protein
MERIVAENWSVLAGAPVAFVAALCLGVFVGWMVIGLIYNQRLTHYQELIANYRDVLEDKLPARALRAFPLKRSKQMSFGLVLIFVGVGAVLIGAAVVAFDHSPPATKTVTGMSPAIATASPTPVLPTTLTPPLSREFTDRTPRELLALYDGRTPLQADSLIEPFKGKWIKASGTILNLIPDGMPDASIAVLKDGDRTIECRLGPQWSSKVVKLNKDDVLAVIGKIAPHQNGSQLYLSECEIAPAEQISSGGRRRR